MKKLLLPAAAALALGLSFAAPAAADEASYGEAISAGGIVVNDASIALGHAVCEDIANGVAEGTTVVAIYQNTSNQINAEDAQLLYDAAAANLCA
ncbi:MULTISPECIES: DUF732 domain-containing protein [Mycobacteriaceae]|uniref:DUF732 domain-containing protein n=1 Tax=Mycobacteriaceae TaxID=1762 RepID=UPI0007FC1CDB|nr:MULTISPECIES: DUF732 domain-containing protein [Mycobacteriaceae]MCK0174382.1 DUF732 domain-containing protein [Mycolicibacterium sp. F2034L]OBB60293.1 hypothetical protein A5757_09320 [Mycobacterium sp. 852013-51886_SCH5428379]